VSALQAHLLLDTGPTGAELGRIRRIFAEIGVDADAQGHSYGGPPPTSAFLIVVNTALVPFLDIFAARPDGAAALRRLAGELLGLRADPRRWGRPHSLRLEDAHSDLQVVLGGGLPEQALQDLLTLDLSRLDQTSPPLAVEWHPELRRWVARSLTAPVRVTRRLPRRDGPSPGRPGWRRPGDAEIRALWRMTEDGTGSAVQWQRAMVVLRWALGRSVPVIARQVMLDEDDVRRILSGFAADGFAALQPDYAGTGPVRLLPVQHAEIMSIAARGPREFGLDLSGWTYAALADFLVAEGVVGDIDAGALRALAVRPAADGLAVR
jgi:hypothetical protein